MERGAALFVILDGRQAPRFSAQSGRVLSSLREVREYVAADGSTPYAKWFNSVNAPAAAKVAIPVTRMAQWNLSNVKSVGGGLQEYRIDFGSGYRIYFGRDGDRLIILLGACPGLKVCIKTGGS